MVVSVHKNCERQQWGSAINSSGDVASEKAKWLERTLLLQDYQQCNKRTVQKQNHQYAIEGEHTMQKKVANKYSSPILDVNKFNHCCFPVEENKQGSCTNQLGLLYNLNLPKVAGVISLLGTMFVIALIMLITKQHSAFAGIMNSSATLHQYSIANIQTTQTNGTISVDTQLGQITVYLEPTTALTISLENEQGIPQGYILGETDDTGVFHSLFAPDGYPRPLLYGDTISVVDASGRQLVLQLSKPVIQADIATDQLTIEGNFGSEITVSLGHIIRTVQSTKSNTYSIDFAPDANLRGGDNIGITYKTNEGHTVLLYHQLPQLQVNITKRSVTVVAPEETSAHLTLRSAQGDFLAEKDGESEGNGTFTAWFGYFNLEPGQQIIWKGTDSTIFYEIPTLSIHYTPEKGMYGIAPAGELLIEAQDIEGISSKTIFQQTEGTYATSWPVNLQPGACIVAQSRNDQGNLLVREYVIPVVRIYPYNAQGDFQGSRDTGASQNFIEGYTQPGTAVEITLKRNQEIKATVTRVASFDTGQYFWLFDSDASVDGIFADDGLLIKTQQEQIALTIPSLLPQWDATTGTLTGKASPLETLWFTIWTEDAEGEAAYRQSTTANVNGIYNLNVEPDANRVEVLFNDGKQYEVIWKSKLGAINRPIANMRIHPSHGPSPLSIRFSDESTGVINDWHWDFGDGITSKLRNPVHTYTKPGIYPVSLFVSGPDGNEIISSEVVTVSNLTLELDNKAVVNTTEVVTMTGSSDINYVLIDFGDQSKPHMGISLPFSTTHIFPTTGWYTVTGIVYSKNEKLGEQISKQVEVVPEGSKNLTTVTIIGQQEGIINNDYPFTVKVGPSTATTPITYIWEATDQDTVLQTGMLSNTVSFTWTTTGTKIITVTASNGQSKVVTTAHIVDIGSAIPVSSLAIKGLDTGKANVTYFFTVTVDPANATWPISYIWNATDQETVSQTSMLSNTVSFNWTTTGTKTITVTASNGYGNPVMKNHAINIQSQRAMVYLPIITR